MSANEIAKALPITIRSVTKTYDDVFALDNVDLEVRSGEFLTLLGPSGSGKTTLLMVLAGFTRPDYGSLLFGDEEVIRMPPHKREVGMVFQNYALFPHMNVAGNIGFPLRLRGFSKKEIAERVDGALATVQLEGYGKRGVHQLSGGQKQRVALARAIVFEPRILLMDEPLSALDKKLREHMQIELRRLHEKLGMTTVYVTHDQREALTMSDRIAVINFGRLVQLDQPRRIYDYPSNAFVANFIGESTLLKVDYEDDKPCYAGKPLNVSGHSASGDLLMLRPERLKILNAADTNNTGTNNTGTNNTETNDTETNDTETNDTETNDTETNKYNRFDGQVRDIVYQGESFLIYVELEDGTEVSVRSVSQFQSLAAVPETGGAITLGLHPEETVLIDDAG